MELLLEKPNKKPSLRNKSINNIAISKKVKPISPEKELLIAEFKDAIAELNLVRAGKKEARNLEDFLNEL